MIIIPLLQKLIPIASLIRDSLLSPQGEAKECTAYFRKVLSFMSRKGGHLANIGFREYFNEKASKRGFGVCINYYIEGKKNVFLPQSHFYNVDTTTWKDLARDLAVLGRIFEDATTKSLKLFGNTPKHRAEIVNLMDEFNQYLAVVKNNAKKCETPHRTP